MSSRRGSLSLVAVLTAMAMVVLDAGMLNVALPPLSEALGVDLARSIWVVSAYQMALLVGLLPAAQLAERFGQRRTFIVGVVVYLAGSLVCAASQDLAVLIIARAVQGLGGAVILALGISILRIALGEERLGSAISWNALVVAFSSAAAPSVAAAVLAIAPWPWLFLVKIPLGFIVLITAKDFPKDQPTRPKIDPIAIAMHGAIAEIVMLAITNLLENPVLAAGLLALAAVSTRRIVARIGSDQAPLWPLDLIGDHKFRRSVIASIACFAAQTTGLVGLPILLQTGAGMTLTKTAIVMTVWPISVGLTAPVAGRLADRFGASVPCALGGASLSVSLFVLWLGQLSSLPMYAGAAALGGLGFGLFQVPNNRSLFFSAPVARGAAAGGMQGSARLLGQTIGALIVGIFLSCFHAADAAKLAMGLGGFCAAGASFVSLLNSPRRVERRHA